MGDIGFVDVQAVESLHNRTAAEGESFSISYPFPLVNRKPQSGLVGQTTYFPVTINNFTGELTVSVKIYDSKPENCLKISSMEPPNENSDEEYLQSFRDMYSWESALMPHKSLIIWLSFKPKHIGLHTSAVHFTIDDATTSNTIDTIERLCFLMAENELSQSLKGRIESKSTIGSIPMDVLNEGLSPESYPLFFRTLLNMESNKIKLHMRDFDKQNVKMIRKGHMIFSMVVPGLAEKRPSLVIGDIVFAIGSRVNAKNACAYKGIISRVMAFEVYVEFDDTFVQHYRRTNEYDVQFTCNNVNMSTLYQAVGAWESLSNEILFPSKCPKRVIQPIGFKPISCTTLNTAQHHAIEQILGCDGGSPYVIHGLPGTGKSLTMIEAILQVYLKWGYPRILVCAPSDSARDYILDKLSSHNAVGSLESDVCRLKDASDLQYRKLKRFQIIVSTYTDASLLHDKGIEKNHFSHIFLDDAGQVSEPETMVPLNWFCWRATVVVLAGDPMQLGPVTYSTEAARYGWRSYLERVLECQLYADGNENYITRLVQNYRSDPRILCLSSNMFYDRQLIACKESADVNLPRRPWLPNPDFPVVFMDVMGVDEEEGSNRTEAAVVLKIIKDLVNELGVNQEEIGVITPYQRQASVIREALEAMRMEIKVGSVEEFQGQERNIIIVSTVRSTDAYNEFDRIHNLGFLSNPKRFNVSITRAQSRLILVGNPHIITKDEHWLGLLRYCKDKGSYILP